MSEYLGYVCLFEVFCFQRKTEVIHMLCRDLFSLKNINEKKIYRMPAAE